MSTKTERMAEPGFSDDAVRKATGRDWDEWTPTGTQPPIGGSSSRCCQDSSSSSISMVPETM